MTAIWEKRIFLGLMVLAPFYLWGQKSLNPWMEKYQSRIDEGTHLEIGIINKGITETWAFDKALGKLTQVEPHPDKLFEIGSISKVLTAYLTHAVLRENKEIELNTRVKDLGLSFSIHPENHTQIIHLLNHTSTLPKMPPNYLRGMIIYPRNPYLIYTPKRLISYYRKKRSGKKLGEAFSYSNMGYGILGLIISEIEVRPFGDIFYEKVQQDLGLANTLMGISEKDYPRLFIPEGEEVSCLWDFGEIMPAGGAYSSINDLLMFANKVIEKDQHPAEIRQNLLDMEKETLKLSESERVAQGWRLYLKKEQLLLYHQGGSRGYKSFIGIDVENKSAIVFLSRNCGLNKNNGIFKELGIEILMSLVDST